MQSQTEEIEFDKILEAIFKFNSSSSIFALGSFLSTSWDKFARHFRTPSSEREQAINTVY